MKKTFSMMFTIFLVVTFAVGGSVYGFNDVDNDPGKDQILELKQNNIISGIDKDRFAPNKSLTFAQGISIIVKGFDLNIDHIRFIKQPLASDYFTNVKDDAWYADAFIIAQHLGFDIPKDVDPNEAMTKEQFGHYLFAGLLNTGDYAFIELFVMIEDQDDIDEAYSNSIQKLLVSKITKLDKDKKFHPKNEITRSEAAVMLQHAIEFVKKHNNNTISTEQSVKDLPVRDLPIKDLPVISPPVIEKPDPTKPDEEVKIYTESINEEVQKVIVDWGEQPHPGYGISVSKIEFDHSANKAIVYYQFHFPDPDRMYPQVIIHAKAETFVPAGYEVEGKEDNKDRPIVKPAPKIEKPVISKSLSEQAAS